MKIIKWLIVFLMLGILICIFLVLSLDHIFEGEIPDGLFIILSILNSAFCIILTDRIVK